MWIFPENGGETLQLQGIDSSLEPVRPRAFRAGVDDATKAGFLFARKYRIEDRFVNVCDVENIWTYEKTTKHSYVGVSKNRGTPKSSILIGFSIINHPFWDTTIFGNTHVFGQGKNWRFWCLCMLCVGALLVYGIKPPPIGT